VCPVRRGFGNVRPVLNRRLPHAGRGYLDPHGHLDLQMMWRSSQGRR
jgi:hypothetical protein